MNRHRSVLLILTSAGWLTLASITYAGMPAPLPSQWTQDNPSPIEETAANSYWMAPHLQAISFFLAGLLLCAWAVKGLWLVLRKDLTWLPPLTFGRSLSLVILWGMLFVVVLTMISGARELMTPGAWRKQGWTYRLNEPPSAADPSVSERRIALEKLRFALWKYAAAHAAQFPPEGDTAIEAALWNIPGHSGAKFGYVAGRAADDSGRVLVYEPPVLGEELQVLLTNGVIGTMPVAQIREATELPSGS